MNNINAQIKQVKDFQQGRVYELTPQEASNLCSQGYVFNWLDKKNGHNNGEPKIRKYLFIGKW